MPSYLPRLVPARACTRPHSFTPGLVRSCPRSRLLGLFYKKEKGWWWWKTGDGVEKRVVVVEKRW